jgi:hypothetical protein
MAYTNIDDPSAYFQTLLWTGNSTDGRALTNDGNSDLQPDWVWLKNRNAGYNHFLQDSSRGNTKVLRSDSTAAESTATNMVESFDTNGFTVGFDGSQVPNFNGNTFVAWQWKANGGTTSTNTDGDINSTVQVNQDAGFSIVTDSPTNNTARSIGHGLGVAPQVVIRRARTRVESWRVFHSAAGSTGGLTLNQNYTYNSSTTLFTGVTSTTFGVGTDFSVNGNYSYVSYCFAEKQGYSKFGKYVGNGNADGAFVYTGFKPEFVIVKRSDSANNWIITDNARGINGANPRLYADLEDAEGSAADYIDHLSNGFKIRTSAGSMNTSGGTYIYMAFAENPFVTSTGIPTTAR